MEKNIKIAHIIHPVIAAPTSDLLIAQPITFETMHTAREFAGNRKDLDVQLYAVQYSDEERIPLPGSFIRTRDLSRSVVDVGTFRARRKLALIKDIMDILYESCDADYMIYTNVDIALQPYFYQVAADIIRQDYDAFIINRRTIPGHYRSIREIPLMFAEIGEKHPGWDCFIFKREFYPQFMLGNACIGTDWIGRIILSNMAPLATRFKVFTDMQMTFHIGDDRVWQTDEFSDYAEHNKEECRKTLEEFDKKYGPFDRNGLPGRFLNKFT
ncbi:MAG: hypothetical protein NT166_27530 [Candidatus Aminicenantes bacterium]|nr:hypothetical protein [Candidatus Aminicenantes bacterium]